MRNVQALTICVVALSLLVFGCAQEEPDVPPVLNIINDLDDLSKQAKEAEMDLTLIHI